jgi:hypothetical protein
MRRQLLGLAAALVVLVQAPLQAQWPEIHTETGASDYGFSVAIEGDLALVGDPNGFFGDGSVDVFQRVSGTWTHVTTLDGDGSASGFGISVDLTVTSGACRAIVGASFEDSTGAAYFYDCSDWSHPQKVTASDAGLGDAFGTSVSINGDLAAIGAIGNDGFGSTGTNDGAAYVFRFESGTWKQEAKLAATSPEGASNLGTSVSISGTRVAAGAPTAGDNQGAVFIFDRVANPSSPTGFSWPQQAKLTATDNDPLDELGRSVSLNGNLVLAGATGDDSIAANSGAAYVFRKGTSGWVQDTKIKAFDAQAADGFGSSVFQSGSWAAIGAIADDDAGSQAGAIYVFDRDTCGVWHNRGKIISTSPLAAGHLGQSVQLAFRNESTGWPGTLTTYLTVLGGGLGSAHWFESKIPAYVSECPPPRE